MKQVRLRLFLWMLLLTSSIAAPLHGLAGAVRGAEPASKQADAAADAFFTNPKLVTFDVELTAQSYAALQQSPRRYVPGKITVAGQTLDEVGIRLTGTGTFQSVNKRPNLALKFNWKRPEQEFAGLTKVFLKNSLQDPSYFCEFTASGAFAAAGVPVPRVTHARLRLNGRDLGLCVVAEAVNRRFLKRHFQNAEGLLYEGAFRDITTRLEQDSGPRGDDREIRRLVEAAALPDPELRQGALGRVLDLETFLNFLAVEMIVANWDGYALHQNNYRVYHDPATSLLTFIPHGMDNTIFETGLSLMPPRKAVLVKALLERPADREAFRQRVALLLPKVLESKSVRDRIRTAAERMKQGASSEEIKWIEQRSAAVIRRVEERKERIREQLEGQGQCPVQFDPAGMATLEGWKPKTDWNESPTVRTVADGQPVLLITATNRYCFSSWRLPLWLPPGRYRLEGMTSTFGVNGLPSMTGSGAGVRALGTMRGGGIDGSHDWASVHHDFAVQEGCEYVELIAELRAYSGQAMFDPAKFRLTRLSPAPKSGR